jgi:phosphoribulokinase
MGEYNSSSEMRAEIAKAAQQHRHFCHMLAKAVENEGADEVFKKISTHLPGLTREIFNRCSELGIRTTAQDNEFINVGVELAKLAPPPTPRRSS